MQAGISVSAWLSASSSCGWFLGAPYIAKLSDAIGRKNAIMICLFGALFGYIITIASLFLESFWLLVIGRGITGFTAGNQPIAQAAMIDMSASDAERDQNMGYIVAGISAGLVGGPIIGGVLSDPDLIGDFASLKTAVLRLARACLGNDCPRPVLLPGCAASDREVFLRTTGGLHPPLADRSEPARVSNLRGLLLLHVR